jgi:hypothetical protein
MMIAMIAGCDAGRTVPPGGKRPRVPQNAQDASTSADVGESDLGFFEDGAAVLPDARPDTGTFFDASESGRDASAGGQDAAPPDGGLGFPDAAEPIALCTQGCSTPDDCVIPGTPLYDASHYVCDQGACRWTGCRSESECRSTGQNWTCAVFPGWAMASCVPTCGSPSDCASSSPLYDFDNYICDQGVCRWKGCNDTSECIESLNDSRYVCEQQPGLTFKSCERTCATPSDCAMNGVAYDADNYVCDRQRCRYIGCLGDTECRSTFMNNDYVCR